MTALRERLAQMHAEATYGTPYGKVDARVAAALVAVAGAAAEYVDTPAGGINGTTWDQITAIRSGANMCKALDALAAALGVSR